MRPKFCPKCGKEIDKLIEGLCKSCFREKKLAELPERIRIVVCKNCGKIQGPGAADFNRKNMEKILKDNLKVNGVLKSIKIKDMKGSKKIKIKADVSGLLEGVVEKTEDLETVVELRDKLCETCGKVRGGYYEAVIQIRSGDENKTARGLEILEKSISKRGVVTKIEKTKGGYDIYFTPKKISNHVLKELTGIEEVKKSYTLVTKKDGRDLYRNTILVRL